MPFTPFHLGPGALLKAVARDRFSFVIFGGSQVLIDLEPLVRMVRADAVLHGPSHTIIGATAVAAVSAVIGRPIGSFVLRHLRITESPIQWRVALLSAFAGTFSHILLDAIMHHDMRPLWPVSAANPILRIISLGELHLLCIGTAAVGGAVIAWRALRRA